MSKSAEKLPRFRKAPVVETGLGIFLRPLERMTYAHHGILWAQLFRTEFPTLEERFGDERLQPGELVRWQVRDRPEAPRLWAAS